METKDSPSGREMGASMFESVARRKKGFGVREVGERVRAVEQRVCINGWCLDWRREWKLHGGEGMERKEVKEIEFMEEKENFGS